jgi:hypothetical protein
LLFARNKKRARSLCDAVAAAKALIYFVKMCEMRFLVELLLFFRVGATAHKVKGKQNTERMFIFSIFI